MLLKRLTYTEIRVYVMDAGRYISVCDELDALREQLEKDILEARKDRKG